MKLTKKLLSFLHRVFDKDPAPFLALRLNYAGGTMQWSIADARLTTTVNGGPGTNLSIYLPSHTIISLASYLAGQSGYSVSYVDNSELALLGAAVLMDGGGDQALSNGDHLYGYTNVLWSYMEANARELGTASDQIDQMLLQMNTKTASLIWLDELGGYYNVPRQQGEADTPYSLRIIAEVLRPRGNNVAMESAISVYTGQPVTVQDVTVYGQNPPLYNGSFNHDGSQHYNATSGPQYGLFDVQYGYDILNGGDIASFAQNIRALVDRLRDAGTHLRALSLQGSGIGDDYTSPPTDDPDLAFSMAGVLADSFALPTDDLLAIMASMAPLADTLLTPTDSAALTVVQTTTYNGQRTYNGAVSYGGSGAAETL